MYTREKGTSRRARPGRCGSLALAMKNRHFGGECSWILAGKARKCGRFWVFACVGKASGDSVLQVLGNKARKNCQVVPVLPTYNGYHLFFRRFSPVLQFFALKLAIFPLKRSFGSLKRPFSGPKRTNGGFGVPRPQNHLKCL